jgi:transposase
VRILTLRPRAEYEALAAARARQLTDDFKTRYKQRAGIEGTVSQGIRTFELRRTRYLGQAKTHLQHLVTASAMNLTRVAVWFMQHKPKAKTRITPFAALAPVT